MLLLAPYWMPPLGGYTALGTRVLVLGLAAMSVNFLLGFTGVLSFGHAAYFGLGAYGAGFALKFLAPSTPLSLSAACCWAALPARVLGALIVRRRGVYFAMVTIAFGQVFYYIAFQWSSVTGGDDGLRGFSRQPLDFGLFSIDILSNSNAFYYFVLFCFALAVGVMGFILRSPFGRTMIAIRENERRARFLGIPVERHIWIAFTLSCFFIGFAGALYALVNNFADPRGLHYSQSGDFVMMAVMGGMRSFWGPLLGAAVFVVLQDYLSSVTINWMSFVGLLFVLVVLFFPRGLLGFMRDARRERGMSVLEVSNVSKRFGSLVAVQDVSLAVSTGELRAIIGPNGAGKTTFFNLISGFFLPTSGTIVFDGRDVTACRRISASRSAWRARSRSPRSFPSSPCSRTCASPPNRRAAFACGRGSAARKARGQPAGRGDAELDRRSTRRPTAWSANSRMATSARPRSRWRWRCGRTSCCSTSRPPAWAIRRPTRSRS